MESELLYQIHFELSYLPLLCGGIIALGAFLIRFFLLRSRSTLENSKEAGLLLLSISIITAVTGVGLFFYVTYNSYKANNLFKEGYYKTVEGVVEDFSPMPYEGHQRESFVINGVRFQYSDFAETPGYNNARSHGGIIEGNGQHLRICYYNDNSLGNVILQIEEIK
ncbi:MAG: hypothetical protein K5662_02250 [Lachnospiraceae bacterium]|nr:hypothetical protein [Lachnospiraceae bacterium]